MLEFPKIRDIAPPVEPSAAVMLPWMWWVAAGVLAILLLAGLFLWMRAVSQRISLPKLPAQPDNIAVRALEALRQAAPTLSADDFAARLSEIVRTFLHRQTGVLAKFATSPEILGDRPRADQPPPPPMITAFREVLTASDALKYGPTESSRAVRTDALIDSTLAAVKAATVVSPRPAFTPVLQAQATTGQTPPPLPSTPPPLPVMEDINA